MSEIFIDEIIVVPGDPDAHYACITADTRPGPWHILIRTAGHIFTRKDDRDNEWWSSVPWFLFKLNLRDDLLDLAAQVRIEQNLAKPPQRVIRNTFGWQGIPNKA